MKKMYLCELQPGDDAIIFDNNIISNNRHHLESLGIVKNNTIKCLYKSIFNDPVAYLVKNTIIAIRNSDANNIIIYKEDKNGFN